MTQNGDIRSLSSTEGIWRAGVKWEARDVSRLELPLLPLLPSPFPHVEQIEG